MQTRMIIKKEDLDHNINTLKKHIHVPIIGVVKMNGYGIMLKNAVDAWYRNGVKFLAVDEPAEAFDVCSLGYEDIKVLLMAPVYDHSVLVDLIKKDIVLTVFSLQSAEAASKAAEELGIKAKVHVGIDVGMGCFGISYKNKSEIMQIYRTKNLVFEGIYSHFPFSFEKKYYNTKRQLNDFKSVLDYLRESNIDYGISHIASSCSAVRFKETWLDAVRIGSALFGRLPFKPSIPLKKIGILEAEVVDIRTIHKGETTGYAQMYKAKKDIKAAILMLGSVTGFGTVNQNYCFRFIHILAGIYRVVKSYFNPLYAVYNNKRLNIIGRLGQKYTLFDISNADIKIGDVIYVDTNIMMINSIVERVII